MCFLCPSPPDFSAVFAFFSATIRALAGASALVTDASGLCQGDHGYDRATACGCAGPVVPASRMRVHLHPQRRTVDVSGRRSVGKLLAELGVLPGTAMVIRGDELLTDGEMLEDRDEIEIRAVISGGALA